MQRFAVAVGALLLIGAASTDWKFYGASLLGREQLRSFYSEALLMPNGHFRVSTEDLTLDGLEVAKQNDPAFSPATGETAEFERIANSGVLKPRTLTVRELDCMDRRFRVLSVIENDIQVDADKLNQSWQRAEAGTGNGALLQTICH